MSEETQVVPEEVVQPQATEENVATSPESTAEQEVEKEPEKMVPQSEVDKAIQKRLAKEARKHERERMQLETELRYLRENAASNTKQADPTDIPKPKESDFENYSEYLEAYADWKVDVKLRQKEIEQATSAQKASQESENRRLKELHDSTIERGEQKYDDFEDVAMKTGEMLQAKGLRFSAAMVNSLVEAENAPDIVYFLGNNLDEAERIARLPAFAQAKEIGKLEDKLLAKPKKQISKAPEPINPVTSGKASNDTVLSDDLPLDEWVRRRNKQLGR
jgi:hypothetical protein